MKTSINRRISRLKTTAAVVSHQHQKVMSLDTAKLHFVRGDINIINHFKLKLKATQKKAIALAKENSDLQKEALKLREHIRMLEVKRANANETIIKLNTKLAKDHRTTSKLNKQETSEASIQCELIHIETFQSLLKAEREKNDALTLAVEQGKLFLDNESSDKYSEEYGYESDTTNGYELDTTNDCGSETTVSDGELNNPQNGCGQTANCDQSFKQKDKYEQRLQVGQAKRNSFLTQVWKCSKKLIGTILKNQ